jgi:DNA-binding transcriptional regulator YhcF (GntR family)
MAAQQDIFKPPRMQQVARQMLMRHLEQLPVGARLPSLSDLARELGVGRNNLQEAMRALAQEGIVVSRPKLGTFVARGLQGQPVRRKRGAVRGAVVTATPAGMHAILAGKKIELIASDRADALMLTMGRAALEVLAPTGVMLQETKWAFNTGLRVSKGCDLSIVLNPPPSFAHRATGRRPVVVVSTSWHESYLPRLRCDMVGVDQQGAIAAAGEALLRARHQSVGFIGVMHFREETWEPVSALRLRALESGLGRPVPEIWKFPAFGYSLEGGASGFRHYLKQPDRPPTLFAASDEIAVGFIVAAEGHGLRPGRDFHIIGFDGQFLARQLHHGPLTTVDVPAKAMGQLAADLAIQRLLRPERPTQVTYLACELFRGATVAGLRGPQLATST